MAQDQIPPPNLLRQTFGFIGGGNMARAIGATLIERGIFQADHIWVSSRTEETLEFWKKLGVHTTLNNSEVILNCKTIILAVKPQFLDTALASLHVLRSREDLPNKLFVSVIVGIPIDSLTEKLKQVLPPKNIFRVIRTLPNTPLAVGEGITVYCCPPGQDNSQECHLVEAIFSRIGIVEKIDEKMMNAVSALSGSGPAYAYLMTEALADGAVKNGVPRALATKLAAQMLIGAGKMVLQTGKHPGQLKDEVCSPGGTTIAGVHALETGGVRVSLMNAIDAAVQRARELLP
ncbi:pyrroline-5-carboxylate reductase [Diachasma alloeum]|uniref:pyrroline-5-carboxylate reductase n=1 Tax=Diachasma alloeum TaxID=454923 RepID=UPI0007383A61|nr:pyrroline-5-carboxylate reductase [Diachasma alloeum]